MGLVQLLYLPSIGYQLDHDVVEEIVLREHALELLKVGHMSSPVGAPLALLERVVSNSPGLPFLDTEIDLHTDGQLIHG